MSLLNDIVSSISSFKYKNLQVIIKNEDVVKHRTKELPLELKELPLELKLAQDVKYKRWNGDLH